jgi:hypothetical protein
VSDLSPEQESKILAQFNARLDSARRHHDDIVEKKRHAHRVVMGTSADGYGRGRNLRDPQDWQSRNYPKIAFEKKQLLVANIATGIPEFEAKPRPGNYQHSDQIRAANSVVAYYLDEMEFPRTFRKTADTIAEYGDQTVMTTWRRDARMEARPVRRVAPVTEVVFDEEQGEEIEVVVGEQEVEDVEEVEVVYYEGPWIERIAYEDDFPDPTAREDEKAKWWIRSWRATIEELEAAGIYQNLDRLHGDGMADNYEQKRDHETTEAFEARRTGVFTIYDMWTAHGVTCVTNNIVIRHDQDPKNPIYKFGIPLNTIKLVDDDDNLGGISLMLCIEHDQEAYWRFWNGLLDAVSWAIKPLMIADTEEDPNAAKQVLYPGNTITARNGKQTVQVVQDMANLNYAGAQAILGYVLQHMDGVTGMNDAIAGLSNSSNATEADLNMTAAKGRIRLGIDVMDDDWSRVMTKVLQLVQQYGDQRVIGKLTNGVEIDVDPQEIVGQFKMTVALASERALRDQRMNSLQTAINTITPLVQPGTLELEETMQGLVGESLKVLDLGRLSDTIRVKSAMDVAREQNQVQLEAAQQQGELQMQQQLQMQAAMPQEPPAQ